MLTQYQQSTLTKDVHETLPLTSGRSSSSSAASAACPRVALLTPYTGGNFGDAAIQDAMIANLRLRLPDAQFSGISLNSDNYLRQHGTKAFPLCATGNVFYGMSAAGRVSTEQAATQTAPRHGLKASFKAAIRRVPGARWLIKMIKPTLKILRGEFRHCVDGYHFL